jgi:hypothetical protein
VRYLWMLYSLLMSETTTKEHTVTDIRPAASDIDIYDDRALAELPIDVLTSVLDQDRRFMLELDRLAIEQAEEIRALYPGPWM